ncbi:MAG TPA: argininosuccinate lyase [Bacillota bacterium]|jgi:argininosuccinate lyase|nr:argininosuccinate lyase [Bacillota bacterium]HNY68136.1 argininosuccinate lyase [Bacillota bacterium]HOI37135.1 argininosuccinate lyase [Bacillota bacterium]
MRDEVYVRTVLEPSFEFARDLLFVPMLEANLAHVLSLDHVGLLPPDHTKALARVCTNMMWSPASWKPERYDPAFEDLFFMIEDRVMAEVGADAASNMHLAMSRNDLEAALFRMAGRDLIVSVAHALNRLRVTLLRVAQSEMHTVMLAHTHNQQAQPTTVGHYILGVEAGLARDVDRLDGAWGRTNMSPLGAAALSGTGYGLDRNFEASLLGFEGIVENTYDAISAADWAFEIAAIVASAASVLGRFVTDLMFWCSNEVSTVQLDASMIQISSIMPQKRNPVAVEHVRAMLGRSVGALGAVATTLHNIPFGDVNDAAEHVQRQVHAGAAELLSAVDLLDRVVATATFNRQILAARAESSFATSTELADTLVRAERIPFRTAHHIVSTLVDMLASEGRKWVSLSWDELDAQFLAAVGRNTVLTEDQLRCALDPRHFVAVRTTLGGPAPESMKDSLQRRSLSLEKACKAWRARQERMHDYMSELDRRGSRASGISAQGNGR